MSNFIFIPAKIDWPLFFKKNFLVIFGVVLIGFFVYIGITFSHELPVWFFRLKTFSFNHETAVHNREAACTQLRAPAGRLKTEDVANLFPASFYKDKHFFEVYYSSALNQCVYAGVDVSAPLDASSTVSFYLASPYIKSCVISGRGGFCVGYSISGRHGPSVRNDSLTRYPENWILPEIDTPMPVPAPILKDCVHANYFTYEYSTSTGGIPKKDLHGVCDWHRFGAMGNYVDYSAVYDKYFGIVKDYLVR